MLFIRIVLAIRLRKGVIIDIQSDSLKLSFTHFSLSVTGNAVYMRTSGEWCSAAADVAKQHSVAICFGYPELCPLSPKHDEEGEESDEKR